MRVSLKTQELICQNTLFCNLNYWHYNGSTETLFIYFSSNNNNSNSRRWTMYAQFGSCSVFDMIWSLPLHNLSKSSKKLPAKKNVRKRQWSQDDYFSFSFFDASVEKSFVGDCHLFLIDKDHTIQKCEKINNKKTLNGSTDTCHQFFMMLFCRQWPIIFWTVLIIQKYLILAHFTREK